MAALTLASGLSSLMPQGLGSYLSTSGSRELRQWTVVYHRLLRSAPFSLDAPAAAPPTSAPAYSCTPGLPPVGTFSTVCVSLARLQANQKSADFLKQEARFYKPPINVTFAKLPNNLNHVGVEQLPCNHCGDCVWGCNNKAKNTTLMNYLPDACNHGAQIFCQAQVRHLERDGDGWIVRFQYLDSAQGRHVRALHRPWGDSLWRYQRTEGQHPGAMVGNPFGRRPELPATGAQWLCEGEAGRPADQRDLHRRDRRGQLVAAPKAL